MNNFLERVKTDKFLQLILVIIISSILFLFIFVLKPLIFQSKPKLPCYNKTLIIWTPFEEYEFNKYTSDFSKYCVNFEIVKKSFEEIRKELPLALAEKKAPDIVYIDNETLNFYKDIFDDPQPIVVDSLCAYYNKDILSFLNFNRPPKTFDELKTFAQKIKEYNKDFYIAGLGTTDVLHRFEIILSLMTLNENYQDIVYLKNNLNSALEIYRQFSNPESDSFVYPIFAGKDFENFVNGKLALYIGFYEDKKKILESNPRLNFVIDVYPLNNFPPKSKIYTKIYYLAPLKAKKSQAQQKFIDWFIQKKLGEFAKDFDLVPYNEKLDLPYEKKVILNSAKNFGETFDFLNKKVIFDNLDRILSIDNDYEREMLINQIIYGL